MFTNQNGCTVWEKTTVNRQTSYVRHEEGSLYWEQTYAQDTDRKPKKSALIIIPVDSVMYVPKPDDRILPGIHEDGQPPRTALTVMSVRDFRYASKRTAHVEVKAE